MMIGFSASAIMSTDAVDDGRIGDRPLRRRHQLGRRRVVGQMRPGLLLQVHRHATAPPAGARPARSGRPRARCRAARSTWRDGDVVRAGRQRQRRHVDLLEVPGGGDRRVAGEHHQRHVGARRDGERRHDLGEARAAGGRGDADLAGGARVAVGHGDGAVLVARMHHASCRAASAIAVDQYMLASPIRVNSVSTPSASKARASMSGTCSLLIAVAPFCRRGCAARTGRRATAGVTALSSAARRRARGRVVTASRLARGRAAARQARIAAPVAAAAVAARRRASPCWRRTRPAGRAPHARRRHWRRSRADRVTVKLPSTASSVVVAAGDLDHARGQRARGAAPVDAAPLDGAACALRGRRRASPRRGTPRPSGRT